MKSFHNVYLNFKNIHSHQSLLNIFLNKVKLSKDQSQVYFKRNPRPVCTSGVFVSLHIRKVPDILGANLKSPRN
jgi:hypothetical protein